MRAFIRVGVYSVLFGIVRLSGQGMTLVGTGYSNPAVMRVAPGQITTLFVSGLHKSIVNRQMATSIPLPKTLGGISVAINQSAPKQSLQAPLMSVSDVYVCGTSVVVPSPYAGPGFDTPDCIITAITLQIPYEVFLGTDDTVRSVEAVVTTNGVASKGFLLLLVADNLHIMNSCDAYPRRNSPQHNVVSTCNPVVTHADGSSLNASSPAKPGETIVIYAYGLGATSPAVKTGEATPEPASVLLPVLPYNASRMVNVQFDFRPNASPSKPYLDDWFETPTASFVGLTPGQLGLYQINVQLPATFPNIPPCGKFSFVTPADVLSSTVESNLTISIGGSSSFDGAPICVEPPK